MRFSDLVGKLVIFKRRKTSLNWICVDPQCYQSNWYRINTDYYDGVVSVHFDGKWVKQLIDPEEAKRWCARDARKRGLTLESERIFGCSHNSAPTAQVVTES